MIGSKSEERYWAKVSRGGANECWEWTASRRVRTGYGQFWFGGRMQLAHRMAWELTHGSVPSGICVLHGCDNRGCCNPGHLFLGTHADNMADMTAKGRQASGDRNGARIHPERLARGERHGRAKLTAEDVRWMRWAYADRRYTHRRLAELYGVSQTAVRLALGGRSWSETRTAGRPIAFRQREI